MAQLIEATEPQIDPKDPMPLLGIDHVEFWVGNAKQAAYYYAHAFGFKQVAYSGLETGAPRAAHHRKHGDGVKVIAVSVPDVDHAWAHAVRHGAHGIHEPHELA